jgi:acyl-CoA synthetase (AMP-forming)/AMP-acid ligase II
MISTSPNVTIPSVPITDYVLRHAARLGDKPALIDGPTGRTLTYRQLADAVRRTAAGLARRGFGKGQVFAIYCPNLPEYAVVFLGVAMAGGINTTVNPLYTADELAKQLEDSGARFLVTVPAFLDKAREAAAKSRVEEVFVFGEAEGARPFSDLLQAGDAPPVVAIDPAQDLVALPYSSGTTGLPKGVMLTHRNLVANLCQAEGMKNFECFGEGDVTIAVLPFFHI